MPEFIPNTKDKLPKEFKSKWLKALRSGKFGQTQYKLTDFKGNYCCLGVACIVAGYTDKKLSAANDKSDSAKTIVKSSGELKSVPRNIPKILIGKQSDNDIVLELTKMNDGSGKSFEEIADWVEKYL